ncbi:MAG: hypothetical protein HYX40_03535 [Sphingobacteriales bacterium]|nr:hypothetical protein [Sphingobacteriales bacterium]
MLTIAKNVHFTRLVKAGGTLKEFNFRKLGYASVPSYHIDTTDERANRIVFEMKLDEGGWTISQFNIPKWILQVKESLQEILYQQENTTPLSQP